MNRGQLEKQLAQKTGLCVVAGSLLWITLLFQGANQVHNQAVSSYYIVRLGPLQLNELSKLPAGDNFIVSLSLKPGIALFFLLCVGTGIAWALLQRPKGS